MSFVALLVCLQWQYSSLSLLCHPRPLILGESSFISIAKLLAWRIVTSPNKLHQEKDCTQYKPDVSFCVIL